MIKQLQILFIFVLVIMSLRFFDAKFLDPSLVNYLTFIYMLGAIVMSIPYIMPKQQGFVLPVQLMVMSALISIAMAYLTWGQGIKDTLVETTPFLIWIVFFFLLHIKIPVQTIEKIIIFYGLMYIVLFFFQLSQSPKVLFGISLWGDEFTVNRGITRIIFPGGGVFVLLAFMAINKLTSQKKARWFWIAIILMGVVIPVLQVTRQFITGVLLIYLYHLIRGQDMFKRLLIFVSFAALLIYVLNSDIPMIKGILEASQQDLSLGKKYVRVQAGDYFLTEFSPTYVNSVFGNGVPYWGFSEYGLLIKSLADRQGYFLSDVGIIAVYVMFGVLAVISYFLIWIKSFTVPLPEPYQYLKYYLWYLLFTSLTSFTLYMHHYMIATVIVVYLYQHITQRILTVKGPRGSEMKLYISDEIINK